MSPLQVEQNSTDRTSLCILLICAPRRQRRLCRQQLMLDAGVLWPEKFMLRLNGHIASWLC